MMSSYTRYRKLIHAALNLLEKKTLHEMKDILTKLQAFLKSDFDKYANLRAELKQLGDAIQDICDKSKQELSLKPALNVRTKYSS
ncbi:hypothetical protein DPMN_010067 [Dreissena polymorpha]|uniref:Uncharacterized protein n=1 Tax=Dreissena polymorpha TaxID=45954 RepID=A0A9D4RYU0_DREPO|nr:hypothetical protein DPMN_010067 [Dreissena polymorpha]